MTTISRMSVCGIRSFGPRDDDIQDIKFTTPVTLILGENGCGKTTIIESLRYACTGEYPAGSDSGKGFLHEPKLCNSSATKARVKLKIKDSNGVKTVISRAAKLEIKQNGKFTISKLDASIESTKPDGEKVAISSRCADISEQVFNILGVSKPILNNVIFCHQEHSSWPLEEGREVKKKFDEIFDATKYNKCIEDLRKYVKNEKQNLKVLEGDVRHKKERKQWVEKKRANLVKIEDELSEMLINILSKEDTITPLSNEIQKICELENTLTDIKQELASKETERSSLKNDRESILTKIKEEFQGNDQELEEAIRNFEKTNQNNIKEIEDIEKEIVVIEKDASTVSLQIQKAQVRLGQLETEKKQQRERIQLRNNQIDTLSKQLNVTTTTESEAQVKDAIHVITDAVAKSGVDLNAERERNQRTEKNLQEHIDSCRDKVVKLEQENKLNIEQRNKVQNKQRDTNSQLRLLENSDGDLKSLNNRIDAIDRQIKFHGETLDPVDYENKLKDSKKEIENLETEQESLERNYAIYQKNYATEETIATRAKDILKKDTKIFELKNTHYQDFNLLFNEVPDTELKQCVERRQRETTKEVDEIKRRIDSETQRKTTNSTSNRIKEEELKSLQKKLSNHKEKISDVIQDKSYDQTCLELERDIEKLQEKRGHFSSAKIMYEKFVTDFQSDKPCCPVCDSDFTDKRSLASKVVTKIKALIEGVPGKLEKIENELKKKQELFNRAQQLKPVYEESKALEESIIPALLTGINESKEILSTSEINLKELNEKIKTPKLLIDIANKVISDAALIDKYNSEVDSYKKEVKELRERLIRINTNKSREEVERDKNVCRTNITDKRNYCDKISKKIDDYRRDLQELKDDKSKLLKERLDLEKSMHCKPQLVEQVALLEEEQEKLKNEIGRIDNELVPAKESLVTAKDKLDHAKTDNERKYKERIMEHNEGKSAIENIRTQQNSIETCEKKNYEEQLKTLLENFKTYKNKEESFTNEKKQLAERRSKLKENQAKAEVMKRNLDDNVEIRKKAKAIEALNEKIKKLQEQIGAYNYTNMQKEKQQLMRKYEGLIKDISNLKGQQERLEKNIDIEKKELNEPLNRDAYNIHKKKYYELLAKQIATEDALKYSKGLEDAIIQFHKEKMSTINKTIRELWQSVYKGNDIDYIQIRTETTSETAQSSRRTYDYKVVQYKNNVEIEMRGRCSAGQKVLACLMIRVALAMTFSHNCGVLALDEPTTNLDRENIQSLCEALASMIHSRRFEKSFQLLIITHDEEFIKNLSHAERLDSWLRVKRKHNGNTVIETEWNN